jgi:hypothetical protein
MSTFRAIVAVTALAALGLPVFAESAFEREMNDRHAIEKLMWTYARALDTLNAEAYAASFTADGQFGSGATPPRGMRR